jgi:plasmid maintenance system killer protein
MQGGRSFQDRIQSWHSVRPCKKLHIQLLALNTAERPEDMDLPGWSLHPLKESLADHWSVKANGKLEDDSPL